MIETQSINNKLRQIRKQKYQLNSVQKQQFNKLFHNHTQINFRQLYVAKMIIKGIPSSFRNKIWPHLVKNDHGITWNYYKMLCQRVASIRKQHQNQNNARYLKQFGQIQRDIQRTFPQLKLFQKGNQQYQSIFNILSAWAVYRQDIGYIQGMSNIAAILLIQLKQIQVFPIFSSLVTSDILFPYYSFDTQQINKIQNKFDYSLRIKQQNLYYHLKEKKIETKLFLLNWIINLFTRCLQFQILGRIWDMILLHELSLDFILQVALRILISQKSKILKCQQPQQILKILKKAKINQFQQQRFMKELQQYSLSFPFQDKQ